MDRSRSLPRGLPFRLASDAFLLLREYVTGLLSIPIYLHSSDGAYYGMVMSVHPSVRPSIRVSVLQSQFSALFSYMLWHIKLKFCMSLSSYKHSIKFEYRQFPSIFVGVMRPFWNLEYWKYRYTVFRSFLLHALTYWAEIYTRKLHVK